VRDPFPPKLLEYLFIDVSMDIDKVKFRLILEVLVDGYVYKVLIW
jgi:hypothetical protein